VLRAGGHIAEIRMRGEDGALSINPLYVPPGRGYSGHLVCFPHYGPASSEERARGLAGHGEAGAVEWRETRPAAVTADTVTFFYGADLPRTQYGIERAVTLRAGEPSVRVSEWVENRTDYDRPLNWNPPRADGGSVSLRPFRARPGGQVYTPVLTAAPHGLGWFTLYNLDHRLLVGYLFPAADQPWIVDWQNRPDAGPSTRTARGIQFGTSPFDEGLRASVERARLFDTPTYRWIGARQRLSTTFQIFLAALPRTFAGVEDVRATDERLTLRERGTRRELIVDAGWRR
jgi:hypothetical protein